LPELPEVETICRELKPLVEGRRFTCFELLWPRTLCGIDLAYFNSAITGRVVQRVSRRGKYLMFCLDDNIKFSFHFRMTGSLILAKAGSPFPNYTRAVFDLDDGSRLFFIDPRKFGRIQMVDDNHPALCNLGPEPLSKEFDVLRLAAIVNNNKAAIKNILLNQRLIAGVGNMYADEALFNAGIHPLKPGKCLDDAEIARLHSSVQTVLTNAISCKGATVSNYQRPGGQPGLAQQEFKVAHQKGKLCQVCRSRLIRIIVGQRGTYLCPVCQPENCWL
jgi:formamidopyrimidine-DNA glycosylase